MQTDCRWENFNSNSKLEEKMNPMLDEIIRKHFDVFQLCYFRNDDLKHVADTAVVTNDFEVYGIGKRVREYEYYLRYPNDFTIRITEFEKIMAGHGDYILYTFINAEQTKVIKYFLIDSNEFRNEYHEYKATTHYNPDGTSFYSFKDYQFRKSIIHTFGGETS